MNADAVPFSTNPALSFKTRAVVAATVVFVVGGAAAMLVKRNQDIAASNHAARVAAGLKQNEQMANGKDCPWDGRRP